MEQVLSGTKDISGSGAPRQPRISVIIPSYNTADLIAACLDSVLAQTYADFEVIVVNDGSPDTAELEKVLEPYMSRIVYIKQENKRAAGARNNAIRQARGEFVAFLDSDDTWLPNHLALQMKLLEKDPALDLVYANGLMIEGTAERDFMEKCPSSGPATFEALIMERCQISISTVVARKKTLIDAGLFDEKLPRCDDYDLWVRSAFHGAKIGYGRTVQARLLVSRPGCLSASSVKMTEASWNILENFRTSLPLKPGERALVEKRSGEIKAMHQLEKAKAKIGEGELGEARKLMAEANSHLHRPKLSLAVLGLGIAPNATAKLISFLTRRRNGTSVGAN